MSKNNGVIQHPLFSFDFDPRWHILPGDNVNNFTFHDPDRSISITIQICAADLDDASIEDFTRALVESRLLQENDTAAALGHAVTIYEPIVAPYPWGRALAWYGHDETGRQFSFSGTVTAHGAICLTLTSHILPERELLAAMEDINLRIQFDRPVLAQHG